MQPQCRRLFVVLAKGGYVNVRLLERCGGATSASRALSVLLREWLC